MSKPNTQQVEGIIRLLLGAGGPIAALLVSKGASADTVNAILTLSLAVGPPLISLVWGLFSHSDSNTVLAAKDIKGVEMTVDAKTAARSVVALAADPKIEGVTFAPNNPDRNLT